MAVDNDQITRLNEILAEASYLQLEEILLQVIHEMHLSAVAIRQGQEKWE